MEKIGWLVNDCITCIPGVKTFWIHLLEWFPELVDKTNGYTDFSILAGRIESELATVPKKPYYIIRNGTYFRSIHDTDVKQVILIQDIRSDLLIHQLDVIRQGTVVVFNTNYVYEKYRQYLNKDLTIKICPLGIDFDFFRPIPDRHPDVLPGSLLFIGDSSTYPKGFDMLLDIIERMTEQNFCLIMKDNFSITNLNSSVQSRVRVFNRVDDNTVCLLINSCVATICTSREETQHLSGIECGACDKPIIARKVGIYFDCQDDREWGCVADDSNFIEKIRHVLDNLETFRPREYFIQKYSTDVCKTNWIDIIQSL